MTYIERIKEIIKSCFLKPGNKNVKVEAISEKIKPDYKSAKIKVYLEEILVANINIGIKIKPLGDRKSINYIQLKNMEPIAKYKSRKIKIHLVSGYPEAQVFVFYKEKPIEHLLIKQHWVKNNNGGKDQVIKIEKLIN